MGVARIFAAGVSRHEDRLRLLRRTASAMKCPPVRSQVSSPVAGDVSCSDAAGLRKFNLAGIPQYLFKRLQSAARLVFSSSRYDHIIPLLRQLHWLKGRERIDFKLALLVYTCQHGAAPSYLADELLSQLSLIHI